MPAPRNLWAWRAAISSLVACSRPSAVNNIPSANSPNFSWPLARSRDCVIAAATRSASKPAWRSPSPSDSADDSSYGRSDCSRPQPSPETSFVTAARSMRHILPHPRWCPVAGDPLPAPEVPADLDSRRRDQRWTESFGHAADEPRAQGAPARQVRLRHLFASGGLRLDWPPGTLRIELRRAAAVCLGRRSLPPVLTPVRDRRRGAFWHSS